MYTLKLCLVTFNSTITSSPPSDMNGTSWAFNVIYILASELKNIGSYVKNVVWKPLWWSCQCTSVIELITRTTAERLAPETVAHQPKTGRIIISMFWCQRAKSEPFNTPSWLSLTFAHTLPSCLMCYSWQANQPTCRLTLAVQIGVLHSVCVLKVKSRVFLLKQKSS